jgi:hypothetical protein
LKKTYNPVYESFLENVGHRIDRLLAVWPKAGGVFKKHIEKIISAAEKYGKYLQSGRDRAEKKGFTNIQKRPVGKDWYWLDAICLNIYIGRYDDSPIATGFWIKGKPKLDPLIYLRDIILDVAGETPPGIELLDYQYFLLSCIHDMQCEAQRQIYFNPTDKGLKDRICRWVRDIFKGRLTLDLIDRIMDKIKAAFAAVEADLASGKTWDKKKPKKKLKLLPANAVIGYSLPLPMTKWAIILGVSENKLRELRKEKKYHFDQISKRKWRLPKHEIPAEYLEKYRQAASPGTQ